MKVLPYDEHNPQSIEAYAKKLIDCTFLEVLKKNEINTSIIRDAEIKHGDKNFKGGLGTLIEEIYFGYKANSKSEPDFKKAGVELKVTPFDVLKNNELRARERLVLSMIDYARSIEENLYESHFWKKCELLLLIYYWRNPQIKENLLYSIKFVSLFTPSEIDLIIIENDYKTIIQKVIDGKAEEISESDTYYLGACTKGATAEKSIVKQWYPPHTPAKKRAFCYKQSYMTYVLNTYIAKKPEDYESLIENINQLKGCTFSEFIISKINKYIGKSDKELCEIFNRNHNNNKAQWTDLAYRMLGIKSNRAVEFRKANITVKVIRLEENGKMKENMSFPPFKYMEIINEDWENSTLHNYFDETKFLFVVFKKQRNLYYLQGCQMWNMPYSNLDIIVREGWQKVVNTIKEGIKFEIKTTQSGIVVRNTFPKKGDNKIIHVRPHAQKRYFKFIDGSIIGDGSERDSNPLPDGTMMPNYSFWINNEYILSQLDDSLK